MKSFDFIATNLHHEFTELRRLSSAILINQQEGRKKIYLGMAAFIAAGIILGIIIHPGLFALIGGVFFLPFIFPNVFVDGEPKYYKYYKKQFLPRFVKEISSELNYNRGIKFKYSEVKASELFSHCDFVRTSDYFEGSANNLRFKFGEIEYGDHDEELGYPDKGEAKGWNASGIFMTINLPFNIESKIFLLPERSNDLSVKDLTSYNQTLEHYSDPELKRFFDVYATDSPTAKILLTPSFVNTLGSINNINTNTRISFINSKCCIFLPSSKDFFETDFKQPEKLTEQLKTIHTHICTFYKIVINIHEQSRIFMS